ncbi:MAG TPA: sigma-70 family RNA polymerase sigma factor [Pedobacter sp.]|nr:sigma-70 family RNA polymerase sigma factor [Pedobacter sp.]
MAAYSAYTDQELLALMKQGDQSAFTDIYRKYWTDIYQSAYKRLRDKEQCQDIVQSVFASFWDRREGLHVNDLAAYLHTSVKFQVLKYVSRKPQQTEFLGSFEELISSPEHADDPLLEKEIVTLLQLYVESLPKKRREVFIMHYTEGLSTREIAERLGVSQKTVQNQINTVNTALRMRLAQFLTIAIVVQMIK